jgi:hypothetical protein
MSAPGRSDTILEGDEDNKPGCGILDKLSFRAAQVPNDKYCRFKPE